jgi:hypothetical protein
MMADNMGFSLRTSWQAVTSLGSVEPEEHQFYGVNCRPIQDHHQSHQAIHIISPPYNDHDYFAPKHEEPWDQYHDEQTSSIYPHPAPLLEPHRQLSSHHLPLTLPSPCSPESIADATMTELTELSPVFSVHMENPYSDITEHNLDILADAFNTALSDGNEEEMFNIQPEQQEHWGSFSPSAR